jgi:hypothetical protein
VKERGEVGERVKPSSHLPFTFLTPSHTFLTLSLHLLSAFLSKVLGVFIVL